MSTRAASRLLALALGASALAVALTPARLSAQGTGTISGNVVHRESGAPLPGVQVGVPGSQRGAVTDQQGRFRITGLTGDSVTLRTQMIGYRPMTRRVAVGATDVRFELEATVIQLDQIVVTGTAGATQQRAIGNSISKVDAAAVTEVAPIANVTELLQARTPGLTIMPGAGTAGAAANIRIRGAGSMNAGNHPVFVIDGVRMRSDAIGGYSVLGQDRSALDAINPDEIESIEVIKGPAASTLYGADAAAGVIQIITKKGKRGEQSVQWTAKYGRGQSDWALDIPTNYTLCTAARIRSPNSWPGCAGLDSLAPAQQRILSQNPLREDSDALRNGKDENYALSVSGGGELYSFYVSGEREQQDGVFYNNFFNRSNARGNFTVTTRNNLDLAFSLGYTNSDSRLPLNDNASNGLLRNAMRGIPGMAAPFRSGWRGLSPTEINQYNNVEKAERFIVGLTANYQPWSWFRNKLTLGVDQNTRLNTLFYEIDYTGRAPYGATNATGWIGQYAPKVHTWTVDYAGTLSNSLTPELTSDFSFGLQYNAYRTVSLEATGEGLVANDLKLVSSAAVTKGYESRSQQNSAGVFAQEQFGWKNRRFITAALRVDNNSAFGENFDLALYPKLSGSWVISEEDFFHLPTVDELRLRAAYGRAGNAPSPFSADRTYGANFVLMEDGRVANALRTDSYGNPDLKAETGEEIELGFDASLFRDRIGVDFTFYNKTTKDALMSVPVPPSTGYPGSQLQNIGTINNKGVELGLHGSPLQGRNLSWDAGLTFAFTKNRLVSFGWERDPIIFGSFDDVQEHRPGYPLAGFWGHEARFNPDGTLLRDAQNRVVLEDTLRYIGPSAPTREIGTSNTLTIFKQFRLYVFADYKGGYYMWNAGDYIRNKNDRNAWAVVNPDADPEDVAYRQSGTTMPFITKADFIKLREVSLTYSLPTRLASRAGARSASLTLAGRNLGIWTKYNGMDPELNFSGSSTFNRSEYMSVPMLRRFLATVNLSF